MRDLESRLHPLMFIGVVLWLGALWYGTHQSCAVYHVTPDIDNFGVFVDPVSHVSQKYESKFIYFFGLLIMLFAGGIISMSLKTSWLDRRYGPRGSNAPPILAMIFGLGAMLFLWGISVNGQNAIAATQRINWHGRAAPSALVDPICNTINLGGLIAE